ncbi:helix-turn-helix domain-containing protein [Bradyrhizobium arachidis]|uniref:helix-turn-helix domain-containing protein n=1 Tax=Bradyrhizobium arachidis TaxID=858423 RepID=UPI0021617F0E|nr:helix-turn-helix domain-containing protein [Bradyrhizobium arachidis]UVO30545.1 helix-turn-helix domain-containing protein [Bradyrhizobium arachidis]
MIRRGFKYKLDPTAEQEVLFRQFAGACRAVYNAALYQRENFWRQYAARTGGRISYASQCRELTTLRASFDWIAAVSQTCQQQALRDLDKAYQNFFAGRAKYPTPRRKSLHETFRFQGREVEIRRLNRN